MDKKNTGKLIKEARLRKNHTQSELGDLIGVSNKAISRWENGESFPDVGVIEALANTLDLKIQDIVTGETHEDEDKVVVEVVRIAKLQKQERKKYIKIGICGLLFLLICFAGTLGLSSLYIFDFNRYVLYGGVFFVVAAFLLIDTWQEHGRLRTELSMVPVCLGAVALISFVSEEVFLLWEMSIIEAGKLPLGIELYRVGPMTNNILIVVFVLNLLLFLFGLYERFIQDKDYHIYMLISLATIMASCMNGSLLRDMSSFEEVRKLICNNIVVAVLELILFIILGLYLVKKCRNKEAIS